MIIKGDKWTINKGFQLRVMAVEENYVMARYTGCMPFVQHMNEFKQRVDVIERTKTTKP